MLRNRVERPSPAMVVALLALFVAASGTTYAAVKINGKDLVNKSVAGKKLKPDTVKGKQVNEAKLGQVPSAAAADTAASAETANTADTATTATMATNATQLGGLGPGAFLRSAIYQRSIEAAAGPTASVSCDPGDPAIAGGVGGNLDGAPITLIRTAINASGTGSFQIGWTGTATPNIEVYCIDQTP